MLSVRNAGSDSGETEVWGGPLSNGSFVLALLNRGAANATVAAPFSAYGVPGMGDASVFCIRDLWMTTTIGTYTGSYSAAVPSHDIKIFKLTPGAC